MLGIDPPKIYEEIERQNEAALAPHFTFVRTVTALAAGLLGLSAPQAPAQDHFHAQLSLWAMSCLGSAIVLGGIALYGDVNIHKAAMRRCRKLLKKHNNNHAAAHEEFRATTVTPPWPHLAAFWIQCLSLFVGIIFLVWSKFPTQPPPSRVSVPSPAPITQPQTP